MRRLVEAQNDLIGHRCSVSRWWAEVELLQVWQVECRSVDTHGCGFRMWTADRFPEFAAKAELMAKWACNHVR